MNSTYLICRTPKNRREEVLWCIGQAHVLGYEGICFEIGVGSMQDPITSSWDDFSTCVRKAASLGLKLRLRGQLDAPAWAYQNGAITGPSGWAKKYNAGNVWPQPYRVPLAVAAAVGALMWNKAWILARDIYRAAGLAAEKFIQFIATNENGLGGANGPWLARYSDVQSLWKKFEELWKQYTSSRDTAIYKQARSVYLECLPVAFWPEDQGPRLGGYTEPGFYALLRAALEACKIPSEIVFWGALEGAYKSDAEREVASFCGIDAHWIAVKYPRVMVNRYCPVCVSPSDAAAKWFERYEWQLNLMRTNAELKYATIEVCEAGLVKSNAPADEKILAACRNAVVKRMREVVPAGVFCALPMALGDGYSLFNADKVAIGGPVGPKYAK